MTVRKTLRITLTNPTCPLRFSSRFRNTSSLYYNHGSIHINLTSITLELHIMNNNGPSAQTVDASTLVGLLRYRALYQPDRHAYTFLRQGETEEARLTYGELDRQARAIGALLQYKGMTGKHVLLLHPPGLQYVAAFFGCMYGGAIAVPAYPPRSVQTMPRIQAIVADTQASMILTTAETTSDLQRYFSQLPGL